jgi:hypothetical protein
VAHYTHCQTSIVLRRRPSTRQAETACQAGDKRDIEGPQRAGLGSTTISTVFVSSRPTTARYPTRSCLVSGVSILLKQISRRPLSIAAPTRPVMTTTICTITRGTTTQRCSAPGATRRTNRWRWKRCGKQCVSCRGSFTRLKGVVYTIDAPQRRAVLQVVGRVSATGRALVQRPSWASDRSYYSESQYTKWLRFESGASRCARS